MRIIQISINPSHVRPFSLYFYIPYFLYVCPVSSLILIPLPFFCNVDFILIFFSFSLIVYYAVFLTIVCFVISLTLYLDFCASMNFIFGRVLFSWKVFLHAQSNIDISNISRLRPL